MPDPVVNTRGCSFIIFLDGKEYRPYGWEHIATLPRLRARLNEKGRFGKLNEKENRDFLAALDGLMAWAATTGPGVSRCFYEVMHVISLDAGADHDGNVEYPGDDYDAAVAAGLKVDP